jgi:DNA-binding SARP family transcriptional activator
VTEVAFALIGPLDIRCRGQTIAIPAARQRSLLAALLLRANQPVAKHSLCEVVWADGMPDGAETTLRSYVMRLRRLLGPALASRLVRRPPGYLLRLDEEDELDLLRFQGCINRGKAAARVGEWERSMREFGDGLALWRGEPLCDVPSDSLQLSVIPALTERRMQAWEGLHAAALRLGRVAEIVVPLQRLSEEDPLSERLSALLMSALAHCNRRIDALAEFRRLRQALVGEYGVEPSKVVRDLHQRLLCDEGLGDPAPGWALPCPTCGGIPRVMPG